ncbi:MAG TPA: hypothetical protein VFW21_15290 [Mycobacterium sp.]|nr:hypothetical protein [Mycobacterium sp.]
MMRASSARPARARHAANDFSRPFWAAVRAEIRWAFTPPFTWLLGVLANLLLAAAVLAVQPLTPHGRHQDWVILVGTYFSSFILADVTTTNLLGADHHRVLRGLSEGTSLARILAIKNLALLVVVGLPTLTAAMVLTLIRETPARLAVTIPNVAVPIVSWIGVGNAVSVLLPVASVPMIRRWRRRGGGQLMWWLVALSLPYGLYYVADPMDGLGHRLLWAQVPAAIGPVLGRDTKSFVHLGIALGVWACASAVACLWVSKRGLRMR